MSEQTMDLAILNGQVIIPGSGVTKANVYVKDGKISALSGDVLPAKETIDAAGKYVAPGIFDPHTHIGLMQPMAVEAKTECGAALAGGVTTVGDFLGGPQSHFDSFPGIKKDIDAHAYTDVIPHLVIGTEQQKSEMQRYIKELGVRSFKVYLNGIPGLIPWVTDEFILGVFEEMKKSGERCMLCAHCENPGMVANAIAKMQVAVPGEKMTLAKFADTHPPIVEAEAVQRIAKLAQYARQPVYIVHLFTKEGVRALEEIRQTNPYVNVETTSPYLVCNCDDPLGKALKMEPPFQGPDSQDALWRGLELGLIDTIGTDNVTLTAAEKKLSEENFWNIFPGYTAVQHHMTAVLDEGTKRGIPIEKLITAMTKNPAEKFGVYPQKGSMFIGSDADLVVFDMETEKAVKASEGTSRSDFSIYEGRCFRGWPVVTIKNGVVAAKDGKIVHEPLGKCIVR